jgi:hypothetical protein
MQRQLTFDLQTMVYVTALDQAAKDGLISFGGKELTGIRYNVVRRPLSGGKGTIVQHKPTKSNPAGESKETYFARLSGIIQELPAEYFMRWKIPITAGDIFKFRRECLDHILEQLYDWWEQVKEVGQMAPLNWRHPFGVYNPMDEGNASDLDEYLATGSTVGLQRVETLFGELV